jgi:hypothetical protein
MRLALLKTETIRGSFKYYSLEDMIKLITTSWDDGHPLDIKIADLLEKYNLKGTFYIPKTNPQNEVMPEKDIISLSKRFEIGGHTLGHKNLNKCDSQQLVDEIEGCFNWLKKLTGQVPVSFCPPFGKYNRESLDVMRHAGFTNIRTTGLLSPHAKLPVMDTTMQVYNHSRFVYLKHLLIRSKFSNLKLWLKSGSTANYLRLAQFYLNHIDTYGGCFHIWGHSWEIEEFDLWNQLEDLFKLMANRARFEYIENRSLPNQLS